MEPQGHRAKYVGTLPRRRQALCRHTGTPSFEIDVYPDWKKQAILEVELNDEEEKVEIPDLFEVIQEVTDDRNYKNYEMAKEMPKEFVKRRNQ